MSKPFLNFSGISAPPPIHSIIFVIISSIISLHSLPTLDKIDEVATISTFTRGILNASPLTLSTIRLAFGTFILGVSAKRLTNEGSSPTPNYLPQSRLKSAPILLKGLTSLAPFTLWCWVLLGISFLLSGTVPLLYHLNQIHLITRLHLRLSLLTFEMAAPLSFLVSTVVKYALWPHALKRKGPSGTTIFKSFYGLVTHNLNVVFVLIEVLLLGGLPVELSHVAISLIFGLAYVLFAWWMSTRWGVKNGSPQFLYFFFDTTLGWMTTYALIMLLVVLLVFYTLFSYIDDVLEHLEGGVVVHVSLVVCFSCLVCRLRD